MKVLPDFDILSFPMEILIEIFKYLNPSDLSYASLTCKKFLEATKYHKFVQQRVLFLHKANFSEELSPISDLLNAYRYFPRITLYVVRFTDNNFFWMVNGQFVQTLVLKMCIIKQDKFLAILRFLPNLKELTIYDCNELLNRWHEQTKDSVHKPKLNNLLVLKLQKLNVIKPIAFDYLIGLSDNIKHISICDCFAECKDSSMRVKMIDHCVCAISKKCALENLESLDMSGTPVDDIALSKLAEIPNLCSRKLAITLTGRMSKPVVLGFLKHQSTVLTSLDLSESTNFLDYGLSIVCERLPHLEELRLRNCVMISDYGLQNLIFLKKLKLLDISGCERVSDNGFQDGVVGNSWVHWKEELDDISIGSNNSLTELTVFMICCKFQNVTHLDVSSSTNCITDYSVQLVIEHLVRLRVFNLECCGQVSDRGITGVGYEDERSRSLRIGHTFTIARLKGLHVLKLSGVYQITDMTLRFINFLELKEISFARCQVIGDEGLYCLAKNCPSLQSIDLTECQGVSDYGVEVLTAFLQRLRFLKVTSCDQLTDLSVNSICDNCSVLKTLFIRGCSKITKEAIQQLVKVSSLKYIHTDFPSI